MRSKILFLFSALLVSLQLTSCATLTEDIVIETQADPSVHFDNYKSYAWLGTAQVVFDAIGQWEQPTLDTDEEVRFLINRELRAKGLHQVEENADVYVSFAAGVDTSILELKEDPESEKQVLVNTPKAALVVALVDGKSGYAVWLGHAVGNVQGQRNIEDIRKRIDYAVTQIFKSYNK